MSLKLGSFPVTSLVAGSKTEWNDGVLTVHVDSLARMAAETPNVERVSIEVASPGESARIIHAGDIIEPRVKVEGGGIAYPGICDRSVDPVGFGTTHRFDGLGVIESSIGRAGGIANTQTAREALQLKQNERPQNYIDMAGSGAVTPYGDLHNVCVSIDAADGLEPEDHHVAIHTAALVVADELANAIRNLKPPQVDVYDTSKKDPALPGIVTIFNVASGEAWSGLYSKIGTAVYGLTRLSAPWLLRPEEMLDGAVSQRTSWHFTNNPLVKQLLGRHGKDLNYLGTIIQRTNWGGQRDMQLSAARSAQIAELLGADGAIITTDMRGRRFIDTVLGIQACERLGIKTTLVTEEEDDESGNSVPLLVFTPEMEAIVSTGAGAAGPFPSVERVLGAREGDAEVWSGELPYIVGRYGSRHIQDFYGHGVQTRVAY